MKLTCLLTLMLLQTAAHASGVGAASLDFLTIDIGPRQTAMGGSGVAVADDLFGANKNPAALGRLWRQEVSFMHANWLQDATIQYLGYARPNERVGTFAGSLLTLDYGAIQGYNGSGVKTDTLDATDRLMMLSYGRALKSNLWIGADVKYIMEKLDSVSASAPAVDIGALYQPPLTGWLAGSSLGFAAKNLGPSIKFDQVASPLPRELSVGAAVRPFSEGLTIALDLVRTDAASLAEKVGAEYWIKDLVAFRMGYNTSYNLGTGLGFGFGVKVRDVQIDYAFADYGNLNNTHHISLSYRFGSVAEDHYQIGMKHMREEDYAKAIVEFSRVLSVDPQHRRALLRIKEANEKLQAQLSLLKE